MRSYARSSLYFPEMDHIHDKRSVAMIMKHCRLRNGLIVNVSSAGGLRKWYFSSCYPFLWKELDTTDTALAQNIVIKELYTSNTTLAQKIALKELYTSDTTLTQKIVLKELYTSDTNLAQKIVLTPLNNEFVLMI